LYSTKQSNATDTRLSMQAGKQQSLLLIKR